MHQSLAPLLLGRDRRRARRPAPSLHNRLLKARSLKRGNNLPSFFAQFPTRRKRRRRRRKEEEEEEEEEEERVEEEHGRCCETMPRDLFDHCRAMLTEWQKC